MEGALKFFNRAAREFFGLAPLKGFLPFLIFWPTGTQQRRNIGLTGRLKQTPLV